VSNQQKDFCFLYDLQSNDNKLLCMGNWKFLEVAVEEMEISPVSSSLKGKSMSVV